MLNPDISSFLSNGGGGGGAGGGGGLKETPKLSVRMDSKMTLPLPILQHISDIFQKDWLTP